MKFREYEGLDLTQIADEILTFWKKTTSSSRASAPVKALSPTSSTKAHLRPMACRAFTT